MEAKRKRFSFNFVRLCLKSALEHIIKGQSTPGSHYFYYFFVGNIALDFQCPRTPLFFINFLGKHCPGPHYISLRLPWIPLYFIFPDQKFCPELPQTKSGALSPSCILTSCATLSLVDKFLVKIGFLGQSIPTKRQKSKYLYQVVHCHLDPSSFMKIFFSQDHSPDRWLFTSVH